MGKPVRGKVPSMSSAPLRAKVRAGRLVLDEPTTLPEGAELELVALDDVDELDPADRARLHGFLAESIARHVPGSGIAAGEVLAELRAARR